MSAVPWILLSYRVPREPSRLRLAAWRRLRRLGAVLLHDAVWTLPLDAKAREAFEWIAEEIEEQGGSALLWTAEHLSAAQERAVVARFREEADERYREIAAAARAIHRAAGRSRRPRDPARLQAALRQLGVLERGLRLERRRDYFRAAGRTAAESAVRDIMEELAARLPSPRIPGGQHAVGNPAALSR
jgi:hypothetical protein